MVSKDHDLSIRRQCGLLLLARSNLYYRPKGESADNLRFMVIIDKQFLETPWYGSRQMARYMQRQSHKCDRHRVRRLMRLHQSHQVAHRQFRRDRHEHMHVVRRQHPLDKFDPFWLQTCRKMPRTRSWISPCNTL